jgi:hypothetical protein
MFVVFFLALATLVTWRYPCGAAPAEPDCASEAAALSKDESELPRLEVPADRPTFCITLETVMAFADRLKAHVAHCPNSDHAAAAGEWQKTRSDYARRFSARHCRPTLVRG